MCADYRIPHSEFLRWSDSDRDKAIWQHIRARQTCPNCGTRAEEWDPRCGGHPGAYVPDVHRCEGCYQLADAGKDLPPGSYARLKLNPEVVK
ncbi:hypothetical protein [Planobispora longispora]|uniref:Uncharacterized protein n=1 Tax=Planobispora longispora TaxID=28887 RepID=A0A8J3RK51_9ACTN|nr:hypothetical protein [Planobispora longispora]BFE85833.1 hypothetical protein GCM10020093_084340 [Planobispora longispora]GIH76135.1 hypothetical protein Plo01_25640 [Planobispora longispora]